MLIGIDGNEANIKNRVGVNKYAYELLCAIKKTEGEWGGEHSIIVYLKNPPLPDMPPKGEHYKYEILPGKGFWIIKTLMPHLFFSKKRPDVFFSPSHYVPPLSPMPKICSIMDLGYLKFSGQFKKMTFWQLKYWTAISIFVSKRIIAISNATKKDIVRHYPFASRKISVTHLAYDKEHFNQTIRKKDVRRVQKKYALQDGYVLFLSTLKPSKNVVGLIRAFDQIKEDFPKTQLVIAGKKGWLYEDIYQEVKDLSLQKRVIFTGFIEEEDKPALLKGAKLLVSPSFWEGFGLHVLEAMAVGTPVVISNVGSLPEVVGEAGIKVDPGNADSIAKGMERVLGMSKKGYNKFIEMGLKQAEKYSWEKTAKKTLKIITNL
jgi:glycosyltransferase involved in cell wall biosynthesis